MQRELRALRRELDAYPDDASLWATPPGITNSAGNLILHLAGNLQHFMGARLGGARYVRDRETEFATRGASRDALRREIEAAAAAVDAAFARLDDRALDSDYPEVIKGMTVKTVDWLTHLAVHLGYHLGQIDYHRRLVLGDTTTVDTVSISELARA